MKRWPAILSLLLALAACASPRGVCRVTLVTDGKTRDVTTEARTVRDLLEDADVILDADDRVTPAEPTLLQDGMEVRVIRIQTHTETERRERPYRRRTVLDATTAAGETRLLEPGVVGVEELTYRVTLEDGVEVDRHLVRRETVREPRAEVVLVGAQGERRSTPIAGTMAYISHQNAVVVQENTLNQRHLTHTGDLDGRVFSLSAGGTHLLFSRAPTETLGDGASAPLNTLWIVETSTAKPEPIQVDVDSVLWAAWEPSCEVSDARSQCRIAYVRGTSKEGSPGWQAENDLWVARPRPSTGDLFTTRQILEPREDEAYSWWGTTYAWSPDGERLAYATAEEVGIIRARDGRRTPLHQFAPYRTYAPWVWTPTVAWSPEGTYIVTTVHGSSPTDGAAQDSPVFDIWALSADGTITAELTSEVGMWSAPAFAPDGKVISFGRARSPYASHTSSYDLHLMDRDGSDRRLIFPPEGEVGLAYPETAWDPQGDQIAVSYQDNLYLIAIPGNDVGQLTDSGGVSAVQWVSENRDNGIEQSPTAAGDGETSQPPRWQTSRDNNRRP